MNSRGVSYQRVISFGLLACVILGACSPVFADDADDLIAQIIAKSGKSAKAADELIKIAEGIESAKDRIRLCKKAYECGIAELAGYESAAAALDMLLKCDPDGAAVWDAKRLDLYRIRYVRCSRSDKAENGSLYVRKLLEQADKCEKAGDWSAASKHCTLANSVAWAAKLPERQTVTNRMRDAKSRVMIAARLVRFKKAVEKDPDDLKSRNRLVETYLIEMDMPAEAAKCLNGKLDKTLQANVALAAGDIAKLPEADLMTLGQWYRKLTAKTVYRTAKVALLRRAQDNLTRYLELHEARDISRARAMTLLKSVQDDLEKLNAPPATRTSTSTSTLRTSMRTRTLTLRLSKSVTMKFVRISPGKFVMGSPVSEKERRNDEGPQRMVTITKPFYMGVTEVTQQQYATLTGKNPSASKGADLPVVQLSQRDCLAFCKAMSKITRRRVYMPTEAQWEYACRAGTKTRFSFKEGDADLADYAWHRENSGGQTHPVGRKKPNAWGLYDMHGNVWEQCIGWYAESYDSEDVRDPKGPDSGECGVIRGGSMHDGARSCRSASRYKNDTTRASNGFVGFRVIILSGSN